MNPKSLSSPLSDRLDRAGIRHFDELIHDQSKEWLIENFKEGADARFLRFSAVSSMTA